MPLRRHLSWSAAVADIRADRTPAIVGRALAASRHAARIEAMHAERGTRARLWTPEGGFDRKAIMAAAIADARAIRPGSLARGSWRKAMSEALTSAWAAARAARAAHRAAAH